MEAALTPKTQVVPVAGGELEWADDGATLELREAPRAAHRRWQRLLWDSALLATLLGLLLLLAKTSSLPLTFDRLLKVVVLGLAGGLAILQFIRRDRGEGREPAVYLRIDRSRGVLQRPLSRAAADPEGIPLAAVSHLVWCGSTGLLAVRERGSLLAVMSQDPLEFWAEVTRSPIRLREIVPERGTDPNYREAPNIYALRRQLSDDLAAATSVPVLEADRQAMSDVRRIWWQQGRETADVLLAHSRPLAPARQPLEA
jgi:hypothetical protein